MAMKPFFAGNKFIFNVQSASTLFARHKAQKIRQLSSWIRKLTDYIFKQCDKHEVIDFFVRCI